MMVDVSVVIINFNTFQMTCDCIESVFAKTFDVDVELILVDNASTERNADEFLLKYPNLRLIKSPVNLGFAKGNNLGIEQARGKYILLLNSDTQLINNAIKKAFDVFESDSQIGVLSGKLLHENGDVQAVAGRFPSIHRELFDLFRFNKFLNEKQRSLYYLGTEADYTKILDCDWVWGTFFMFKRDDLNEFPDKKLHDDFFMYGEDVQWCYYWKRKLRKRVIYCPDPEVYHDIGGSDRDTTLTERFLKKMLPNQHAWMKQEKGIVYTRLYYLIKSLHHLSLRSPRDLNKAKIYFRYSFL